MNGFEFAKAVRGDSRWQDTPLVALSSHTSQQDMDRGRSVGFNDYVAKKRSQRATGSARGNFDRR